MRGLILTFDVVLRATVGLTELVDNQDDDQMEGVTAMDLDSIVDSGSGPF